MYKTCTVNDTCAQGSYLNKQVSHHMYEEDFQGVDLHGRIHIPEVDWMSSTSLPNQNQEEGILFSTNTK